MEFNESQKRAVRHCDGPMLLLAGPGSGKTTVITHRIKYMTEEHGVRPDNILVITFTKAAANEMIARTNTDYAPWIIVEANSKYYARLKVLETVIDLLEKKLK